MRTKVTYSLLASVLALASLASAQPDTLRKLADLRGIRVGAAVTFPNSNTAEYQRVLKTSFNTAVCENAMKFQNLSSSRNAATGGGNYNFGPADAIVNFADTNGMKMRGHTFVWHSQAAGWFTGLSGAAASRDTTLKIMRMHIDTLGKRYKGKIIEWDVVNEGINQGGGTSPNYRTSSPWYRIGADYFDSAFVIAQRTDTGARLLYNDFGAEGATGAQAAKSQNVYDLVSGLKARGIPIHGVGLQSHFSLTDHDTAAIGPNMRRLAALGLTISMTEIDISTSNTTQNWETQKQKYKALMKLCLSVPACLAYVPWGLNDNQSWRGASATALLFTGTTTITPKPAYWGVVEALEEGSTQTSAPSAPWNVLAVSLGNSIKVSWNAPWTDGRSAITGYKVMAVSDTNKTCTTTGARTCNVSGLVADSSYRFMVRAINAVGASGTSPWSASAKPSTVNVTLPGAPKTVTGILDSTNNGVKVSWLAPDSNGGATITGYMAVAVSDSSKFCTTSGALTCTISGLAYSTSYTFIVKATNVAGTGAASSPSSAVNTGTVGVISSRQFLIGAGNFTQSYTFVLPEAAAKRTDALTMMLLDVTGRVVWKKTVRPAMGEAREIAWDGRMSSGAAAPAGVYLVRVRTAEGGAVQEAIQRGVRVRRN